MCAYIVGGNSGLSQPSRAVLLFLSLFFLNDRSKGSMFAIFSSAAPTPPFKSLRAYGHACPSGSLERKRSYFILYWLVEFIQFFHIHPSHRVTSSLTARGSIR